MIRFPPPRRSSASCDRPIFCSLADNRGSLLTVDTSEVMLDIKKKYEKVTTANRVVPHKRRRRSMGERREREGMCLSRQMLSLPKGEARSFGL